MHGTSESSVKLIPASHRTFPAASVCLVMVMLTSLIRLLPQVLFEVRFLPWTVLDADVRV